MWPLIDSSQGDMDTPAVTGSWSETAGRFAPSFFGGVGGAVSVNHALAVEGSQPMLDGETGVS